jgi:thioredoxin reductase (NADPH)
MAENVIIAGSGPAGCTAAIYAARADLNPLVFEGLTPGGQLTVSYEVANYPGFPEPLGGMELMDRLRRQAQGFGARFDPAAVERVGKGDHAFKVQVGVRAIETKALIVATGAEARRLPIPSEKRFYGRGVSGCATCDGFFYRGKEVIVVGGGNAAMEDAVFLTRFASKVIIVHRREYLRADPVEVKKARENPKIEWMIPWVVEEILGSDLVTGARLRNTESNHVRDVKCEGVFVAIGHDPRTEVFRDLVRTDDKGFILVEPGSTKTSTEGVFACGDVCDREYKQAVVAAGQGCMAAMAVERYLGVRE